MLLIQPCFVMHKNGAVKGDHKFTNTTRVSRSQTFLWLYSVHLERDTPWRRFMIGASHMRHAKSVVLHTEAAASRMLNFSCEAESFSTTIHKSVIEQPHCTKLDTPGVLV